MPVIDGTRLKHAAIVAPLLTLGILFFLLSSYGQKIEENFGLPLLFKLRGVCQPADKAAIVNIDHESSEKLGFSGHYSTWPRTVHAELVNRLVQFGAEVIAFDIHFAEEKGTSDDLVFAEAIQKAGNVILVEKLQHKSLKPQPDSPISNNIEMDQLIPPIQPLAEAALALAPFPLPKLPVRVDSGWLFKASSGEMPTLPAAVFQVSASRQYDELYRLLRETAPQDTQTLPSNYNKAIEDIGLVETMRKLRFLLQQNNSMYLKLREHSRGADNRSSSVNHQRILLSLLDMYGGDSRVYINFYGPPATHSTITYYDVLSASDEEEEALAQKLAGKAVFVGAARNTWSNQKDGFYTVFSQTDGLDISGVGIAATLFTNLWEHRLIKTISILQKAVFALVCALIVCTISFVLQPFMALLFLLIYAFISLYGAHVLFSTHGVWVPVVFPLIILPFSSFLIATCIHYFHAHRKHKHVRAALGYYVPDTVVEELSKDLSFIRSGEKRVYSTCLMSDIQRYTALSERLTPEELSQHMKEYYGCLFKEVKRRSGIIGNVIGDSMLALWPSAHPQLISRENGCRAALQIARAVSGFNERHPERPLPTRIGLHSGYLLMDNIGAEDHFEYAPIGDIVNTASRVEGLNKHLSTRVLASEETMGSVDTIACREVGVFLLGGKTQTVRIYELIDEEELTSEKERLLHHLFPEALELFRRGQWKRAKDVFGHCLNIDVADGPSHFYAQLCQTYILKPPPAETQGVVNVVK